MLILWRQNEEQEEDCYYEDSNCLSDYNQFPEWYWVRGFHDALLIEVDEREINSLEGNKWISNEITIPLDSSQAIWDTSIQAIVFRNAKLIEDGRLVPGKTW